MTGEEAILDAVRAGDAGRLHELLDAHPELIDGRNELGQSAVLLAKYHRQEDVAALLLERGATLNVWEAAAVGDNARVMELIEGDESLLDRHSRDGFTPLGLAAFFGNEVVAHNLLAKGANASAPSNNPMRVAPIHSAVAGRHLGIVRRLLGEGADANAVQQQGFTPLHGAASAGDEEIVRLLLAHGAQPGTRAENGQTPLDLALAEGHAGVASLLEA